MVFLHDREEPGKARDLRLHRERKRETGRIVPVSAASRTGRAFWDQLSDVGKKALVLNVPTTYPPHPLNGVLISGFLTPKGKRDFVYPPSLLEEIEQQFGPYPLYMRTYFSANLSDSNAERFLRELHEESRIQVRGDALPDGSNLDRIS